MPADPIPIAQQTPTINVSGSPATSNVGLNNSLFGKWSAFSAPAKSGSPPTSSKLDIPPHMHEHDEEHDSLEFGDLSDLRARGWAAARGNRRAVSMSVSPNAGMNTGFNGPNISPPQHGALAEKMARGQGVLRRLSLSNGFAKQPAPPPIPGPPNPTPIGSLRPQENTLAAHPPAAAAQNGSHHHGRRRFSESGARKRGVSPMGERLLRDQVHF